MITAPLERLKGALVVAVDDSASSREALRYAMDLAAGLGEPLGVLHVWNYVNSPRPGRPGEPTPPEAEWQAAAERRLAALLEQERRHDVELRPVVVHGNTTPVLLQVSRLARHLVVGTRGRGGFAGLLLGSTSEDLVRHASCPVTIVRHGTTQGAVVEAAR